MVIVVQVKLIEINFKNVKDILILTNKTWVSLCKAQLAMVIRSA